MAWLPISPHLDADVRTRDRRPVWFRCSRAGGAIDLKVRGLIRAIGGKREAGIAWWDVELDWWCLPTGEGALPMDGRGNV